ncbi:MAG: DMT family transporter, partial [Bacteroidota bacterium]
IISTRGDVFSLKFSNIFGVSLALGSSIIWATYWLFNVKDKRDEIAKLLLNFFFGLIFILAYNLIFADFIIPDKFGVFAVVWVGLFEMGITFVFWLKALKYSETTATISNLIYLSPFISLIFINFALGEKILISSIIGLTLIVLGVVTQQYFSFNQNKIKI